MLILLVKRCHVHFHYMQKLSTLSILLDWVTMLFHVIIPKSCTKKSNKIIKKLPEETLLFKKEGLFDVIIPINCTSITNLNTTSKKIYIKNLISFSLTFFNESLKIKETQVIVK